ncbi:MAG: DUF2203 family protein [Verrucomicrobiota bacterium]|jgi:hypothetical protein
MTPLGSDPGPRYRHHYSIAEATGLLPLVGRWLHEMRILRQDVARLDERLAELRHEFGDQGGTRANEWTQAVVGLARMSLEFRRRDLVIEDLDRGLVGFPAIMAGREVLLSWEEGDESIGYWKELGPGHHGREKMT